MTNYLVGIDGGGTSCRARIRNDKGALLGEAKTGSANIQLGVDKALSAIIEAVQQATNQAKLPNSALSRMDVGLALAGAELKSAWFAFMQQPHPFASMTLNTDAYGACLGAHNADSGAILIAGTGSCGLLIKDGRQHVLGGREFPISDHGSGAMMGLKAIQETLLGFDDIKEYPPLAEQIMSTFNHDIDAVVTWSKTAKPCDYAQFSPLIFQYAKQADPLAIALLKQTAADIEMLLIALNRQGATDIALMGSIGEHILDWLSPTVSQWLVPPQSDAIEGAIMIAGQAQHNLYSMLTEH
ncbi:BadF/BadG/BcrA/BcrD ATPase family protein [Aliivibrio kagoshimensis]|uniref:BadF/BadG/BcrA/BcrD ATPase family protein n=1 Tax=Aliivibrio kagoshimensis TaxID=2910230 RepID=UPI003D0C949E